MNSVRFLLYFLTYPLRKCLLEWFEQDIFHSVVFVSTTKPVSLADKLTFSNPSTAKWNISFGSCSPPSFIGMLCGWVRWAEYISQCRFCFHKRKHVSLADDSFSIHRRRNESNEGYNSRKKWKFLSGVLARCPLSACYADGCAKLSHQQLYGLLLTGK